MSGHPSPGPVRRVWWSRPGVVLPLVGTLLVLVALLTPQASGGRFGDSRLSSHLSGSMGARVLAETARRFGWTVVSRDAALRADHAPGHTVHAVLAPVTPLTREEAHQYLEAVRGGDALLYVLGTRTPLQDSLGATRSPVGGLLVVSAEDSAGCRPRRDLTPPLWPDGQAHLYGLRLTRAPGSSGAPASGVPGIVDFAHVSPSARNVGITTRTAAGFTLGKGRVAIVADPDMLANDVLRRCEWGADATAMRMLEWLRAGDGAARSELQFDEFHQGFGAGPRMWRTTWRFLGGHPVGRTILQLVLAGLVLLAAASPRPLPPAPREHIERRDPLEQVDALAHAYEQVGATRTATARLLRGVRRRVERGASSRRTDDDFLADVVARAPAQADDVALIRRVLARDAARHDLPAIGAALRRIEAGAISRHPSPASQA